MLSPELQKLKEYLERTRKSINEDELLEELVELDKTNLQAIYESLSMSSGVCRACGRKL